jgi:hypothetical protein
MTGVNRREPLQPRGDIRRDLVLAAGPTPHPGFVDPEAIGQTALGPADGLQAGAEAVRAHARLLPEMLDDLPESRGDNAACQRRHDQPWSKVTVASQLIVLGIVLPGLLGELALLDHELVRLFSQLALLGEITIDPGKNGPYVDWRAGNVAHLGEPSICLSLIALDKTHYASCVRASSSQL